MEKIILASSSHYSLISDELEPLRKKLNTLVFVPSSKEPYPYQQQQEQGIISELNIPLKEVISLDPNKDDWLEIINQGDVIYLHGGNPLVFKALLLEKGVYKALQGHKGTLIGLSAGAMILSENIVLTPSNEEYTEMVIETALNKAPVNIFPHMNFKEIVDDVMETGDGDMKMSDLIELSYQVNIDLLADDSFIISDNQGLRYYGPYFYVLKDGQIYNKNNEVIQLPQRATRFKKGLELKNSFTSFEEAIQEGFYSFFSQSQYCLLSIPQKGELLVQQDNQQIKSFIIIHPEINYGTLSYELIDGVIVETLRLKTRYLEVIENFKVLSLLYKLQDDISVRLC